MISNPNLVLYSCISKGPIILADFSSKEEQEIGSVAQKCIEKSPPNHSFFSHTVSRRTYTFLIDDPFVYFAIYDVNLGKSEAISLLDRLKCAFDKFLVKGSIPEGDKLTSNCLQSQFNPVFLEIMALDLEFVTSPTSESASSRNPSVSSSKGRKSGVPLLGNPIKGLKKKRRMPEAEGNGKSKDGYGGVENKMDLCNDVNGTSRDFPVCMQKGGGGFITGDRKKAKQIWRKHVLVVLFLDFVVCAALFGIWLYVCRGFQCIDADG